MFAYLNCSLKKVNGLWNDLLNFLNGKVNNAFMFDTGFER